MFPASGSLSQCSSPPVAWDALDNDNMHAPVLAQRAGGAGGGLDEEGEAAAERGPLRDRAGAAGGPQRRREQRGGRAEAAGAAGHGAQHAAAHRRARGARTALHGSFLA